MSQVDILYITLVLVAFGAFGATLAYYTTHY
jgi:hypothetical protein